MGQSQHALLATRICPYVLEHAVRILAEVGNAAFKVAGLSSHLFEKKEDILSYLALLKERGKPVCAID